MHVLVNATSVSLGGGITVLRHLLPAFVAADGGRHRYTVLAREGVVAELDPQHERVEMAGSRLGGRSLGSRFLWEQIGLPSRASFGRADVLFSPSSLAVAASPVPQVLMFQNVLPFCPEVLERREDPQLRLWVLRQLGIWSSRLARRVVFISESQRRVILPQLPIPEERAALIYLGRDPSFSPEARKLAGAVCRRLGLPRRYFLAVSHIYHYKNIVELIGGFARALPRLPADIILAIAGAESDRMYSARVRNTIVEMGLQERVRLLGAVPYRDLPSLYAGASFFIFPSTCESFPNILIEGLASGVPTLSSDSAPMPELAGDGALYFNPFSPSEIGAKMVALWQDEPARRSLALAGVRRAARYSWGATARGLLDVLESAAG